MGSLSPSIVEKKASQSLPAFEDGAVTAPPQPVKGCSVPMRPCRIAFEALSLARPAHRLTACRIDGTPMQYEHAWPWKRSNRCPLDGIDHLAVFACSKAEQPLNCHRVGSSPASSLAAC